ncbi:MAG: NAD(P)/FAD-dependent oxidoreductase [Candidatus Aminicenantales bacterium]
MNDVIIIGGGPSGLNAARRLAERGLRVSVLEKKPEIGKHVVCTGIVSLDAFKEFDLSKESIMKEIRRIKAVSPFFSSLIYEHSRSFACVVDREKFDNYLGDKASAKGAEIRVENRVTNVTVHKNKVEVSTRRAGKFTEKYSAQLAIIATGINCNLQKKLGLGYPQNFLNGVQAELNIGDGDYTSVFVGRDIAPGAFAWVVPVGNETVRIGLMVDKNPKKCFKRMIEKFFPQIKSNLERNRIQFKPIAQGLVSKTYGERVAAVGEAAGQVKTTTGGGIYFGLLCSDIASGVVMRRFEEGCFKAKKLAEYEKLWKKAIKKEILIGYYARKICGKLSNTQIERMFQIAKSDGIIPLVREKGDFDWHSNLVLALFRKYSFIKGILPRIRRQGLGGKD